MNNIKMNNENKPILYVDALKIPVFVTHKEGASNKDSDLVRKDIQASVDSVKLKINVRDIKEINKKGVVINCSNKESVDNLSNELKKSRHTGRVNIYLNDNWSYEIINKRNVDLDFW